MSTTNFYQMNEKQQKEIEALYNFCDEVIYDWNKEGTVGTPNNNPDNYRIIWEKAKSASSDAEKIFWGNALEEIEYYGSLSPMFQFPRKRELKESRLADDFFIKYTEVDLLL